MRILVAIVLLLTVACSGGQDEMQIPRSGVPDEAETRGCPRPKWPGPWTACAEARWVERVVEAGGYEVNGSTGSALTAVGRGRAFYVWAASLGTDDSRPVDEGVRTSWSAQGFTFWVESGPRLSDEKPTVDELSDVVAASRRIAPPAKGSAATEFRDDKTRRDTP